MAIDFTEKLGPLPVWGWGVIGGGIVAVGSYFLSRNKGGGLVTAGGATLDASGYQTSGIQMSGKADTTADTNYDNNTLWLSRASRSVAASLSKSPTDVYNTLKRWLAGEPITQADKGIVDTALGQYGTPPEGTSGLGSVTPDAPPKAEKTIVAYARFGPVDNVTAVYSDGTSKIVTYKEYIDAGSPRVEQYAYNGKPYVSWERVGDWLVGIDSNGGRTSFDTYRQQVLRNEGTYPGGVA